MSAHPLPAVPPDLKAKLVELALTIVKESGHTGHFDADRWIERWLYRVHPALGLKRPIDLMDTAEGRELTVRLLAQQQSHAYA
jgi:uncharacterized protein (DUF2384 family)